MNQPENQQVYQALQRYYEGLPHCTALGLKFEYAEGRTQIMSVGWRPDLTGNHHSQVQHGGCITTLVDVTSATAVAAHLPDFEILATLDMRIDYLHPARPQQKVFAKSECYRLSGQVAFVHTVCYQEHAAEPIALGMATFMRTAIPAHLREQLA